MITHAHMSPDLGVSWDEAEVIEWHLIEQILYFAVITVLQKSAMHSLFAVNSGRELMTIISTVS